MVNRKILSVTAHPDDEALGFGATASKLAEEGFTIVNCILSGQVDARRYRPELEDLLSDTKKAQTIMNCEDPIIGPFPNIKFNTVPHLEIVQFIEKAIESVQPDYIFTHHPYDLNNDHYHVSIATQAASRLYQRKEMKRIQGLYFMEIPSSTDWAYNLGANNFQPNTYFEIGEKHLQMKLQAIEAYRDVMRDYPHPRSIVALRGLAAYRGGQAGLNYAEAFQCVFQLLPIGS